MHCGLIVISTIQIPDFLNKSITFNGFNIIKSKGHILGKAHIFIKLYWKTVKPFFNVLQTEKFGDR